MINNIHENEIISYTVDFKNNKIILNTLNYDDQTITIEFQKSLTHKFETEISNSIIFDIEEFEIQNFIEENIELLEQTKNYSWPIEYKDTTDLYEKLKNKKYKYYVISSSIGLSGWVIAKSVIVS